MVDLNTTLIIEAIALVGLFFCSAFFSSAETALFSLNSVEVSRLRRKKSSAGDRIEELLSAPSQLLSTILIGNTLVNVAASALGFVICESLFPGRGEVVAIPAMTLLLLIFGEVAPKRIAMRHPGQLAMRYSSALKRLIWLFSPLRHLLAKASAVFLVEQRSTKKALSEDEFLTVVEVGEEEGVLDEEEREMVDGIISLEETQASKIMTPRVDLSGIDMDDPLELRKKSVRGGRYRYMPVYTGSLDEIHGFLDVPRYLLSGDDDMAKSMIAPYSVPETAPLDTLLATFQKENRRIAIVVDEYGGTAGLVTRGDIIEEIVDDVDSEHGEQGLAMQPMGDGKWLINGNTSLEDINYELDMNLEAEGADRLAGWVSAQAERIPKVGEVVTGQGCRATVQQRRKNRITLIIIEKLGVDNG